MILLHFTNFNLDINNFIHVYTYLFSWRGKQMIIWKNKCNSNWYTCTIMYHTDFIQEKWSPWNGIHSVWSVQWSYAFFSQVSRVVPVQPAIDWHCFAKLILVSLWFLLDMDVILSTIHSKLDSTFCASLLIRRYLHISLIKNTTKQHRIYSRKSTRWL